VIILGGVLPRGSRWVAGVGSLLVILMWLPAVWDRGLRAGEAAAFARLGPAERKALAKLGVAEQEAKSLAFPTAAWLGVGLMPLGVAMLAVADDAISASWVNGLSALAAIALAAYVSRPLLTEQGRRALLGNGKGERRVTWLCPLSDLIASRAVPPSDPSTIDEHRRRRRYAMATESVLVAIACVIFGFTVLFSYLGVHRYGVHLTGGPASRAEITRASSAYVIWHSLDLVPLLDIPHTLNWRLERTFTDHTSGAILLAMKLFIVGPVLRTAALLLRTASESSTAAD
jgi:hypothetical protein